MKTRSLITLGLLAAVIATNAPAQLTDYLYKTYGGTECDQNIDFTGTIQLNGGAELDVDGNGVIDNADAAATVSDAQLNAVADTAPTANTILVWSGPSDCTPVGLSTYFQALLSAADASALHTSLSLGTLALQDAGSVSITGGSITGITDVAIADGGTGASNEADARTNLGLGTIATQAANSVSITGGSITGITDVAIADGGTGASNEADARTNLGLGTIATQAANSVSITGGSITGITDVAVADGGTGQSTIAATLTSYGLSTDQSPTFAGVYVSRIDMPEITDPGNPEADVGRLIVMDNGGVTTIYFRDSTGANTNLLAGSDTNKVMISANDTTPGYLLDKLTESNGIDLVEVGDGGDEDLRIDIDVNEITEEATPASGDYFLMWDTTAGANRKVDYDNMPGAGGGEANTYSSSGAGGVAITLTKSGVDLPFKSINAGSGKITVTNDAGNNEVDIDISEASLTLNNIGGTLGASKGGTGQDSSGWTGLVKVSAGTWSAGNAALTQVDITGGTEATAPAVDDAVGTYDASATANRKQTVATLRQDINNDQTGTTYTTVLADGGKTVWMNNAAANTVTLPTNASVAYPTNTTIAFVQEGAGTTTIEGDTGVTVNGVSAGSVDVTAQYQGAMAVKRGTNTWIIFGSVE